VKPKSRCSDRQVPLARQHKSAGQDTDEFLSGCEDVWSRAVSHHSLLNTRPCAYFARGSGRIWTFTTLSLVPFPPSMCQGVFGL